MRYTWLIFSKNNSGIHTESDQLVQNLPTIMLRTWHRTKDQTELYSTIHLLIKRNALADCQSKTVTSPFLAGSMQKFEAHRHAHGFLSTFVLCLTMTIRFVQTNFFNFQFRKTLAP